MAFNSELPHSPVNEVITLSMNSLGFFTHHVNNVSFTGKSPYPPALENLMTLVGPIYNVNQNKCYLKCHYLVTCMCSTDAQGQDRGQRFTSVTKIESFIFVILFGVHEAVNGLATVWIRREFRIQLLMWR